MSKRNRIFLILFLSINIFYLCFILIFKVVNDGTDALPVIQVDNDVLTISVHDGEDVLLNHVSASDEEDGDLSQSVFIYNISSFNENNQRTVTYGVFDSSNQLVTSSCLLQYSDYRAPRFSSNRSFINLSMASDILSEIHADSVVDGNISNRMSVTKSEKNDRMVYEISVTDSTGTTSSLEVVDEINLKALYSSIDIKLTDYILYLHVGDHINLYNYIDSIQTSMGVNNDLIWEMDIETNFNSYEKGIYEAKFSLNRANGDYGLSKMIIIVE